MLVLRSAVCHLGGESVNKGHYVAYAADREESAAAAAAGVSTKNSGISRRKIESGGYALVKAKL